MTGLVAAGIWKGFAGTLALRGASLTMAPNSIHALVGENGAGKSTLIKVLTGVHRADRGTLTVGGAERVFHAPEEAIASGIGTVYQERNLVLAFSVAENLFLHAPPRRAGFLDYQLMYANARIWLDRVGLDVAPQMRAGSRSVAQGQLLEIARALALEARVLLLDEPAASITERESSMLFDRLREVRDDGGALLFVSHKLEEVFALCDRITVIRDGETILDGVPSAGLSQKEVVTAMVGRSISLGARVTQAEKPKNATLRLELKAVSTRFGHRDIDLALAPGEVVGLYGLVGAGRTELARAIVGLDRIDGGTVLREGNPVRVRDPRDALYAHRIGYVSEDRKGEGLILSHPIRHNVGITIWDRVGGTLGLASPARECTHVAPTVDRMGVRLASLD